MNEQVTTAPAPPSKKQVRKEIVDKLTIALSDYKEEMGEKKIATHVKKISKLISRDLERDEKKVKKEKKVKAEKKEKGDKKEKVSKKEKVAKKKKPAKDKETSGKKKEKAKENRPTLVKK